MTENGDVGLIHDYFQEIVNSFDDAQELLYFANNNGLSEDSQVIDRYNMLTRAYNDFKQMLQAPAGPGPPRGGGW